MPDDKTVVSLCRLCGVKGEDLRFGVCYACATDKERERCERDGHEYDDRPGTAFYDRCVFCDLPRGLAKKFTESHGAPT
jgi:hypothetical protein